MLKQYIIGLFFFSTIIVKLSIAQDTTIYMLPIEIIDTALTFDKAQLNQYDLEGKKHGYWKEYYNNPNKKLRYEGQFNHGIPVQSFKHYYDNGVLKMTLNYFNDGKNAAAYLYHPNGKKMAQGLYKEQKKDSLWKYYHATGYLIAEEFYRKGQKSGTANVYFEDGDVLEETQWVNGKQDGVWKEYYLTTKKPKFIINYKDGLRQGETTFFYESGVLKGTGFYKDSHRDSVWYYYGQDGSLLRKITYRDGNIIQTYEPESVKKAREKENSQMGDKKIEKIEDLDDKLSPFIQKY